MDDKSHSIDIAHDGSNLASEGEIIALSTRDPGLAKSLKTRHLIFFSLGSSIGLGLWLGSGTTLHNGGPVSNVLSFVVAGVISWAVAQATGEIACNFPVPSAFPRWTEKFIDRASAFTLGWAYWLSSTLVLSAEIQGAVTVIRYWTDSLFVSVWVTIFLLLILSVNVFHVKVFGEVELILSVIKFFWIFVIIIMFIVITAGGAPNHVTTGFRYWREIPFINGFKGFLSTLHNAVFSMAGSEFVGLAAAEARNPRKSVPKAVSTIWLRLVLFYVLGSFVTTLCVDPRDPDLFGGSGENASPFVIAMKRADLPNAAHAMNAILLISVLSCGNALAFTSTRIPIGLAQIGMAPKIFLKTDSQGRPWPCIMLTFIIGGGIAYLNASTTAYTVFAWLSRMVGLITLFNWSMLFINHLRFRLAWKVQGHTRAELPWSSWAYPYSTYVGLLLCLLLVVNEFYLGVWPLHAKSTAEAFFSRFVSLIAVLVIYLCAKAYYRGPLFVKSENVDLVEGRRIYEAEDLETNGKGTFSKVKSFVVNPLRKRST